MKYSLKYLRTTSYFLLLIFSILSIFSTFEMAKQSHAFFFEGEFVLDWIFQHEIGLYYESIKSWKPIWQDKRNIIHKNFATWAVSL